MGWFHGLLWSLPPPWVRNITNDSLPTCIHMHMFHRHFLLPFAPVFVERIHLCGVGAGKLGDCIKVGIHLFKGIAALLKKLA